MSKNKKYTTDALEIVYRRYYEGKPKRLAQLEEARAEDELARKNYKPRAEGRLKFDKL